MIEYKLKILNQIGEFRSYKLLYVTREVPHK